MNMLNLLLDLIYPPHCIFCEALLSPGTSKIHICPSCQSDLSLYSPLHFCSGCGKPIPAHLRLCQHCKTFPSQNIDRIRSVFLYKDTVRKSIISFKSGRNTEFGITYALLIADMVRHQYRDTVIDAVVSVPPRRKRLHENHFDQADFLALHTARALHLPFLRRALKQTERRQKQSGLNFVQRYENVSDNFSLRKPLDLSDKQILVIDDVCTSRATLNECARTLKLAGASAVFGATLATTPFSDTQS